MLLFVLLVHTLEALCKPLLLAHFFSGNMPVCSPTPHSVAVLGVQGAEIWEELGDWITTNKPQFGPGTKERFEMASKLTPEEVKSRLLLHPELPFSASGLPASCHCHALPYCMDVL